MQEIYFGKLILVYINNVEQDFIFIELQIDELI